MQHGLYFSIWEHVSLNDKHNTYLGLVSSWCIICEPELGELMSLITAAAELVMIMFTTITCNTL